MSTSAANPYGTRARNWAWIWLCYTGFLFIDPLIEPSLHLWLGTLTVFALFLAIFIGYVRATDEGVPTRFWMIAATCLLGVVTMPWNAGASTFFVYTASFLPFAIASVRRVLLLFAAETLIILAEFYAFRSHPFGLHISWVNAAITIFLMLVIGVGQIFFAEQKRADCKLRAIQEQNVALAGVAERERIARDLHDVLGHTLSVITLKAELAHRLLTHPTNADPARAAAEIADVERTARTALAEVREAITGYRARGLAAEIETARRTLDTAGITLTVDNEAPGSGSRNGNGTIVAGSRSEVANSGPGGGSGLQAADPDSQYPGALAPEEATPSLTVGLSPAEETVLALALREAVTNIVRHSRATTCTLRFVADSGIRRLVVEDNGPHPITREGNGLRGMRERIESIGGQLRLESNNGTRLLITLPIVATS